MSTSANEANGWGERIDRPLLNRDFVLITITSFVFFFNFHSFILLPLRIEALGGSESSIGFIMGAASMATILTTPSVGILIDKWKKMVFALGGASHVRYLAPICVS